MLRDYQQNAVDGCLAYEGMAPLIVCPTGSGKSHIIAELIKEICKGKRENNAMIVSHRKEILEQNAEKLIKAWPQCPLGIYSASLGKKRIDRVSIAQVQSIARRLELLPELKCLIIDEAHLVPKNGEGNYRNLIDAARRLNPELRVIGLTATPYRLQSGFLHKGDGALFDGIAYEIAIQPLIDAGHLAPLIGKRSHVQANLQGVHTIAGEFNIGQMAQAFDNEELIKQSIEEICRYGCCRKSWLLFASSIAHAEHLTSALRNNGIKSALVTGETIQMIRAKTLEDFKQGKIRALVNCDVLTTGFDAPNVDMIALLRATKSTALYVQILGRGMRPLPGKENCLVLDFGENLLRHGPIDDLIIRVPGSGDGEVPYKICPKCESIVRIAAASCPDCGYVFIEAEQEPEYRQKPKAVEGEFLTSQQIHTPQQHIITHVAYTRHCKKGSPDSLRVTYVDEHDETFSEWICLEHETVNQNKNHAWWKKRGGNEPMPHTVADALSRLHELKKVLSIWTKPDGKFTRVLSAQLGERSLEVNQPKQVVYTNFWEGL